VSSFFELCAQNQSRKRSGALFSPVPMGKYIYLASPPGIYRVRITDRKVEQVVSLKEFRSAWAGSA
jgi:hypothetical protein